MWALLVKLWKYVVALAIIIDKIDDIFIQIKRILGFDDEDEESKEENGSDDKI